MNQKYVLIFFVSYWILLRNNEKWWATWKVSFENETCERTPLWVKMSIEWQILNLKVKSYQHQKTSFLSCNCTWLHPLSHCFSAESVIWKLITQILRKLLWLKVYYTHVIQIYVNVRNFRLSFLRWHELHWCKHLKSSSRVGHCFGSRTFLPWGQFPEKLVPYTRFSAYRLI